MREVIGIDVMHQSALRDFFLMTCIYFIPGNLLENFPSLIYADR